ncbi:hypothetical protein D3C76_999590 [compost metagenome]
MIDCKQAGDPVTPDDGYRVLVDRLWPGQYHEDQLQLNAWLPDVAPSIELIDVFNRGEWDFARFASAYRLELAACPDHWWTLLQFAEQGRLTLVFACDDPQVSSAAILAQWLEEELDRRGDSSSPVCYLNDFPDS